MSVEIPLKGKIAVITGASRGIGRAISLKLAEAGVDIIGNSVDLKKKKRVDEVIDEISKRGGKCRWVYGDITDEQVRNELFLETAWSGVDYLFLNAAGGLETDKPDGWAEKINVTAQLALVDTFKRNINKGGAIIYETSLWAHYFDRAEQPPFYRPVAKTKFLAEKRLRELIPELEELQINLGFLCGHVITKTSAYTLMSRGFPDYIKRIEPTAEGGILPTTEQMGQTALNMLIQGFKSGETRYVGGKFVFPADKSVIEPYTLSQDEVRTKLPMYGDNKLLVNSFLSPKEDQLGFAKETGTGIYQVRLEDTNGHFSGDFGDIRLFRGVDQIEAAAQTLGLVFLGLEPSLSFVPFFRKVGEVEFVKMAFPGDKIEMSARLTNMNPQNIRGDVDLKVGQDIISTIKGIELGLIPSIDYARRLISKQKASRRNV